MPADDRVGSDDRQVVAPAGAPAARGSMYFDVVQGRRLELAAINGAAVRIGRELGVATPLNFAVHAALRPYADGTPALA